MTTTTVTRRYLKYDEALELLNECVAERGADYVYQDHFGVSCVNWIEGGGTVIDRNGGSEVYQGPSQPGCIVGMVMAKLLGEEAVAGRPEGTLPVFCDRVVFSNKAYTLLAYAQTRQDAKVTWGEAVESGVLNSSGKSDDMWRS